MTCLWMDGFDHYGIGSGNSSLTPGPGQMLAGAYAAVGGSCQIGTPGWGGRTGLALFSSFGGSFRKVLPATKTAVVVGFAVSVDSLPGSPGKSEIFNIADAGNTPIFGMQMDTTGTLSIYSYVANPSNPVVTATTQSPVIVPQNWHFIETKLDKTAGTIRVDVDGETVLNLSGLTYAANPIAQLNFINIGAGVSPGRAMWMDDLRIFDTSGTHNNGFEGDLRVATLFPNANATAQGWTPQYRHHLGTGILNNSGVGNPGSPSSTFNGAIQNPNSTSTNLGNGEFTLEGFFRFFGLPPGGDKSIIFSKWDETNNRRSFQLYVGGPTLENGNIVFRTSTDGQAGTVVEKISYPWPFGAPDLNRWYHIAIVRTAGELLLFLDGIQLGVPVADTDTYFAGLAPSSHGAQVENSSTVIQHTWFNGWMDEIRWTIGVARYTANFTPTTVPFPRSVVGGDPDFADVALLMGFDNGLGDESSFARPVNAFNNSAAVTPDDGSAAFQTLYHHTPQDDTFIEASLLPATGILTLNSIPIANDTVTVGTYTNAGSHAAVYKFVAAVSAAFDVKIGATIAITLANLVAAINTAAGAGTLYGTGTFINDDVFATQLPGPQMLATANAAGTAGNTIASTDALTDGASGWGDTTLDGGQDIPGPSEFFFDRPPPNTVLVKAVQIVNRSFKTDAGAGSAQVSWIGPLNTVVDGADNNLTLSPIYRWDIFETDPDTGSTITPATIVGGRVRINRTS